ENGELIPVTVVEAAGNVVAQKKTEETDGYNAIQIGFDDKRDYNAKGRSKKYANKAEAGHATASGAAPKRFMRELKNLDEYDLNVGQEVTVDTFETCDIVDVTGTSKGKGFQGSIKRHGFARGPMSHGSRYHRKSGAMAMAASTSRVFKGKKLPGQTGGKTITMQNLEIVRVDADKNVILIKGNVPGPKKGFVKISSSIKKGNK